MKLLRRRSKSRRGIVARIARPFVFLSVLLGLVAGAELSSAIATEFMSAQEAELGRLLNEERVARGLPALSTSDALRTVARRHAQRMMMEGRIFHNQNLREDVEAVFPQWASIGENVGVGPSIPRVHQAFMDSPGHRANIVDPDWGWMGIGVVTGGDRLFMTENFLELQAGAPRPAPAQFRLAGAGRTATARALSDFGFSPGTAGGAVLGDAFDFHGALAGSALAGQINGPIVLTPSGELDAEARDALVRALGSGSGKTVYLVGSFDSSVADAVRSIGANPVVVGGPDFIETSAEAARALPSAPSAAFVATVDNYPDALAASAVAAVNGWPVLYTDADSLSAATREVISDLGIGTVHIVGGTAAVSSGVESSLRGLGVTVNRLSGANRIDTALAIADFGLRNGLVATHPQLATAFNFPDALAAGALAGVLRSPVILTTADSLHPSTANWLRAHRGEIDAVNLLGGAGALSTRVEQDVTAALS